MSTQHSRFKKCEYTEITSDDEYNETVQCEKSKTDVAISEAKRKIINLLLLGKTGSGKSATGNTLLKWNAFEVKSDKKSATEYCQLECTELDDTLIRVVDTPGLIDTKMSINKTLKRIFHSMSLCPEGFNALLYVYPFSSKFTKEEIKTLKLLKATFGENFIRDSCIVVMTKGELFELEKGDNEDYTFENWLDQQDGPPEFMELLEQCQKRVVLMYNKNKNLKEKEKARDKLFECIRSRTDLYTNEMFDKCVEQRNKMILHLKYPHLNQYVQEKLSLIQRNIQKAQLSVSDIKFLLDANDVQAKHSKVKDLIARGQESVAALIDEIRKKDGGTGATKELISEVQNIEHQLVEISALSDKEKESRLTALEQMVKCLKNDKTKKLEKFFGVTCAAVGGVVGGGAAGILLAAVGVATVSVLAPPIAVISGVGAAVGAYLYFKYTQ